MGRQVRDGHLAAFRQQQRKPATPIANEATQRRRSATLRKTADRAPTIYADCRERGQKRRTRCVTEWTNLEANNVDCSLCWETRK